MTVIIPNLAVAGYRSFGKNPQLFEKFEKINLFIGRNNAGKSNIIRFLSEIYQNGNDLRKLKIEALTYHLPDKPPLIIGVAEETIRLGSNASTLSNDHRLMKIKDDPIQKERIGRLIAKILDEKQRIDGTKLCWTLVTLPNGDDQQESWRKAVKILSDEEIRWLWGSFMNMSGGDRKGVWEPQILKFLPMPLHAINVQVIPAIRQIGVKGSTSDGFDGSGIIERLARLQNPDAHNQPDRERFLQITNFLRTVIDSPEATIEIPYERDTILVHMDQKVLPIESLGSGIHEVIILAAAATVLSNYVVCIEEPELHLNPILQRKLIRYLSEYTDNQYFISTHSAALMDNLNVEIYHVKLQGGASVVERVTSDGHRSLVCEDLGYHPSDLLQANCVIWVEGPSDRIYINFWLKALDHELVEGIHYSIMFYGGRLASHLSSDDYSADIVDFISLRRLNRRGIMIIDSDREKPRAQINQTKRRLQKEFDIGPGHAWITDGREIENYIPAEQLKTAIASVCPRATIQSDLGKYDNCLKIKSKLGRESQASKVEIARYVVANNAPDFSSYDLKQCVNKVHTFIRDSNPQMPRS